MKTFKITKRFSHSLNIDRNIWSFSTELTTDAEVETAEQLQEAADKLFEQAKILTLNDLERTMKEQGK